MPRIQPINSETATGDAINVFTNSLNNVSDTDIDVPVVALESAA